MSNYYKEIFRQRLAKIVARGWPTAVTLGSGQMLAGNVHRWWWSTFSQL